MDLDEQNIVSETTQLQFMDGKKLADLRIWHSYLSCWSEILKCLFQTEQKKSYTWRHFKRNDEDKQRNFKMDILMTVCISKMIADDEWLCCIDAEMRREGRIVTEDELRKIEKVRQIWNGNHSKTSFEWWIQQVDQYDCSSHFIQEMTSISHILFCVFRSSVARCLCLSRSGCPPLRVTLQFCSCHVTSSGSQWPRDFLLLLSLSPFRSRDVGYGR